MDDALVHLQAALTIERQRPRQDLPFRLLHDAALKGFGRVALPDLHGLLQDNRSGRLGCDEIRRRAGELDPRPQGRLVGLEPRDLVIHLQKPAHDLVLRGHVQRRVAAHAPN